MSIKHLEDLSIENFIESLRRLSLLHNNEKLDGSEIVFGLDEQGTLYLSRELKGGQRFYSEGEWDNNPYTLPFRSVHRLLRENLQYIKKALKPGDSIEVEVLYGNRPNTICYDPTCNYVAFHGPISGNPDLRLLVNTLPEESKILIEKVPILTNELSFEYKNQTQTWRFLKSPKISLEKIKKVSEEIELHEKLNYIENNFLKTSSAVSKGLTYKDILEIKLNKKPTHIVIENWAEFKSKVKIDREEIIKKLDVLKIQIKEELLNKLLRGQKSEWPKNVSKDNFIEGIVFCENETLEPIFKLVDKEQFTEINKFYQKERKILTDNIVIELKKQLCKDLKQPLLAGRTRKKYIQQFKTPNKEIGKLVNFAEAQLSMQETLTRYYDEFLKLYESYEYRYKVKEIVLDDVFYDEDINEKTVCSYVILSNRLLNIRRLLKQANSGKDLVQIVLEEKIEKRGNVFADVKRIRAEFLEDTYRFLSKNTPLSYIEIKENLLGSTGKTKTCGDIDIAVDSTKHNIEEFKKQLENVFLEQDVYYAKGFNILHVSVPIAGNKNMGKVQVDFMFTECLDWTKFYFYSPGEKSKYKGLYRTELLSAVVAAKNKATYENEELVCREGFVRVPRIGLQYQIRTRKIKNGKLLKTFEVERFNKVINKPIEVVEFLFGKGKRPTDVETFEQVRDLIETEYNEDMKKEIYRIYKIIIKRKKLKVPKEISI